MTILETFIKLRDDLKLWVTNNLKTKANISHTHDDVYYTKTEIDDLELITIEDIDAICGGNIVAASEVTY